MIRNTYSCDPFNPNVPKLTLGEKIRTLRSARGLTQKELGIMCGFPESTADVRIRQYESNKKVPKKDILNTLSLALNIDMEALFDTPFFNQYGIYHLLFDLENTYGLHPVNVNGKIMLELDGISLDSTRTVGENWDEFLNTWLRKRDEYEIDRYRYNQTNNKENVDAYRIWQAIYPLNKDEA